jgi:hypothetical protein
MVRTVVTPVKQAPAAVGGLVGKAGDAVTSLYDAALNRVLARPYEVRTADEAKALLDAKGDDALAPLIERAAVLGAPVARQLLKTKRAASVVGKVPGLRRLPFLATIMSVAGAAGLLRRGVRDVQVIGSYLARRFPDADPEVLKSLTVQLYLHPRRRPRPDDPAPTTRLLRAWLVRGVLGRERKANAERALDAVDRLDAAAVAAASRR